MILGSEILRNIEAITDSPLRNPAVQLCCDSASLAMLEAQEADPDEEDTYEPSQAAVTAYRDAMPSLAGFENIRDYIACVAHGMLLGVIDPIEGPKLLYAAQVALSAIPREPKRLRRKAIIQKSAPPTPIPGSNHENCS